MLRPPLPNQEPIKNQKPLTEGLFLCVPFLDLWEFDLINVKFSAGVAGIPGNDLFNAIAFVVVKHLHVEPMKQIEIDLVAVVTYPHHKVALLKKNLNLFVNGIRMKVLDWHPPCVT